LLYTFRESCIFLLPLVRHVCVVAPANLFVSFALFGLLNFVWIWLLYLYKAGLAGGYDATGHRVVRLVKPLRIAATAAPWSLGAGESEDGGKTWMRLTKAATILSMEESGSLPPGVGHAGAMSAGGDLATVGVSVMVGFFGGGGKENGD
jgi:hypothetical protein